MPQQPAQKDQSTIQINFALSGFADKGVEWFLDGGDCKFRVKKTLMDSGLLLAGALITIEIDLADASVLPQGQRVEIKKVLGRIGIQSGAVSTKEGK